MTVEPSFFQANVPLSGYCTFGVGGPARWLATITCPQQLQQALSYCHSAHMPFINLGKGSNCLFDDAGFDGVVLFNQLNTCCEIRPGIFCAGAGFSVARLGAMTARTGWHGLEFASGIPGSVGGALYMNAGAGGSEIADTVVEVSFTHPDGTNDIYLRSDLTFGYRSSPFQKIPGVITSVTFELTPCQAAKERQRQMIAQRTSSQPYQDRSAGCVFRNPTLASAGALIDRCGLKGHSIGGAQVSPKHANFIINTGTATAQDILDLIALIRHTIQQHYQIDLQTEVCYIPAHPPLVTAGNHG